MIITCEECQARFRLADEKLKPGGTKVRCSKCRHVFTVMPPEPAPAEERVDFGAFNMEPVAEEETVPAAPSPPPQPPPAPGSEPASATAGGDMELDFSGLEQAAGPGDDRGLAEEFSFADTSAPSAVPPDDAITPAAPASGFGELELGGGETPAELDFDATFAESDEPARATPAAGPATFTFDEEPLERTQPGDLFDSSTVSFATEPQPPGSAGFSLEADTAAAAPGAFHPDAEAAAPAEFSFEAEPSSGLSEFSFETEAGEAGPAFGEEPAPAANAESFDFGSGDSFESSALDQEPAFGEEGASAWDQPEKDSGPSFDFDEPSFETKGEEPVFKNRDEAGMNFGEIDFAGAGAGAAPGFGAEPDFSQATLARPAGTEAPPSPRPAPSRPRSEEPLPAPVLPGKGPMSRVMLMLALLLLALCGAGGYFYFMGDGQQAVEQFLLKIKGEEPAAPVEQRIGLSIAGSSYVNNRDAGQLLVIQGSATNNFAGARSAITVKGLLLDAGGKVLQQQTVFCGNYLDDDRLRSMKYGQIEEAMNNQFGDSLANMNVKPGAAIRFTIVFRNPPKELANINVEVVDSKSGGL